MQVTPSFELLDCDPLQKKCHFVVDFSCTLENDVSMVLSFDHNVPWEEFYKQKKFDYYEKNDEHHSGHVINISRKNGRFNFWFSTPNTENTFEENEAQSSILLMIPEDIFLPQIKNVIAFKNSHIPKNENSSLCMVCDVSEISD